MAGRCGCGSGCNCVFQVAPAWTTCIAVPGNGSASLPYSISLILEGSVDNLLECTADGLMVDVNNIPAMALFSGDGISGDGLLATPFEAEYSTDAGNVAAPGTDGNIFVPAFTAVASLPITGNGTGGSPLALFFSLDVGNNATTGTDGGVFVPTGAATVSTLGCVIGDGSGGSPIELFLDPAGGIQCAGVGLQMNLRNDGGMAVSAAGLQINLDVNPGLATAVSGTRFLEDPLGGLQRGAAGVRQTALMQQRTITRPVIGAGNEWTWVSGGLFGTITANDLPGAYGFWDGGASRWAFNTAGVWLMGLRINLPVGINFRGFHMSARRNGVDVSEGGSGTGYDSLINNWVVFNAQQARVGYNFVMQFLAGQNSEPVIRIVSTVANGVNLSLQVSMQATWIGDVA